MHQSTRTGGGSVGLAIRGLVVFGGASLLLGCPNPQTYGTPRTTPSGKIQHTVALEGFHAAAKSTTTTAAPGGGVSTRESTDTLTLPLLPTYQLRVGVADRVDIGARITNLSALGGDVKWNFVKGESVDLAVMPGLQLNYFSANNNSIFIFYGHLPLMAGFNFGESTTLVLSGGLVFAYGSATASGDRGTTSSGNGANLGARARASASSFASRRNSRFTPKSPA